MLSKLLIEGLKKLRFFIRHPAFLLTPGLVGCFELIFTIEWSYPYCSNQTDGPASAVFGMPLPYVRYSGVSSMEYFYMPSILIANLLILTALAFPLVSWVVRKVAAPHQTMRLRVMSLAGLLLLVSACDWNIFLVRSGIYKIPVSTLGDEYDRAYNEFRPVRFTFKDLHYDCTPSSYWFGDGRMTGGRDDQVGRQGQETGGSLAR